MEGSVIVEIALEQEVLLRRRRIVDSCVQVTTLNTVEQGID